MTSGEQGVPGAWRARLQANCKALQERGLPCPAANDLAQARARIAWPTDAGGEPLLAVRDDDGGWTSIAFPFDEAVATVDRQLRGVAPDALVGVVCGGLGSLAEAARQQHPDGPLLVIEPDAGAAAAMLARWDWTADIAGGRVTLLFGPAYGGSAEAWRIVPEGRPVVVLHDPRVVERLPGPSRDAIHVLRRITTDARLNAEARRRFAAPYLLNCLRNVPRVLAGGSVEQLAGAAAGRTAVLVGAGPSLNRNLEDILARRDAIRGCVVISTDTALRVVRAAGIAPQLVVCVDPGPGSVSHLSNLPPDSQTHLACDPGIDPAACAPFDGRTYAFTIADHDPWPWLQNHGVHVGRLAVWGSVLTAATDLARLLGCTRLVYVGADLAYTSDQPYARGTAFEAEWHAAAGQAPVTSVWSTWMASRRAVVDLHGRQTQSAPHLIAFRDWLVTYSTAHPSLAMVNATGAGILYGGSISQASVASAFTSSSEAEWQPPPARRFIETAFVQDAIDVLLTGDSAARLPRRAWDALLRESPVPAEWLDGVLHETLEALEETRPSHVSPPTDDWPALLMSQAPATRTRALQQLQQGAAALGRQGHVVDTPLLEAMAARLHLVLRHPAAPAFAADAAESIVAMRFTDAAARALEPLIVEPLVSFARRAPGAAKAAASPTGTPRRLRIAYLSAYGSLGPEAPMPTMIASLLEAHGRRQAVEACCYVWGRADAAYMDTLRSIGIPATALSDTPRYELAETLHAHLRRDAIDVLVTPHTSAFAAVLYTWRSAPTQVHLATAPSAWRLPEVDMALRADWLAADGGDHDDAVPLAWRTDWMQSVEGPTTPPPEAGTQGHVFGLVGDLQVSPAYVAAVVDVLRANPAARFHAVGYGSRDALLGRFEAAGAPMSQLEVDAGNRISEALGRIATVLEPFDDLRVPQGLTCQLAGRPIVHRHGHAPPYTGPAARDRDLAATDAVTFVAIASRLARDGGAWIDASRRARALVQNAAVSLDAAAERIESLVTAHAARR